MSCEICDYWARESDMLAEHHPTCPKNPDITPENAAINDFFASLAVQHADDDDYPDW